MRGGSVAGGRRLFRRGLRLVIPLCAVLALPAAAAAQQADATPAAAASAPAASAASAEDPAAFTTEQLEQMLAPLALYPDDLLSQILMACTYPLEIVQADRWVKAQADLKDEAAAKDLEQQPWDPSVKSLVAIPDVLALLSEKLDWTQQLGDAFIAQPKQVLDTVQALRARAQEAGQLKSSSQQTVEVKQEGSTQTIVIVSAQPDVVYVPVYDSTVVYGYWPYPAYPPYRYYPPAYRVGTAIAVGFAWGYAWGHCNWHGGDIDIDINRNTEFNRNINRGEFAGGKWTHDPAHRERVPYRDSGTAKRFGGVTSGQATASREVFRGRNVGLPDRAAGAGATDRAATRDAASRATIRDSSLDAGRGSSRDASRNAARDADRDAVRQRAAERSGSKGGALDGVDRGGRQVRRESQRGQASRAQMPSRSSSGIRGGGGGRGGGRGRGGR